MHPRLFNSQCIGSPATELGDPRARKVLGVRSTIRGWACLLLFVIAICQTGCGGRLAKVSGQVSINGKPISGGNNVRGTVCFHPNDNALSPAVGLVNAEGRYDMMTGTSRGVQPGTYQVTISVTEIIPPASPGEAPSGRRISSLRYTDPKQSGLTAEVKSGRNEYDFSIEPAS